MNTIIHWMRKHSLLAYLILAYTFSWIIGIPLALKAQEVIQVQIGKFLQALLNHPDRFLQ